ncbi:hypothetical protein BC833DRAFT_649999 [Globomyces pollinis-pini]|nr:hypothetical protein BC833DRAFT_649999 [Globomyces pollinis-pini]
MIFEIVFCVLSTLVSAQAPKYGLCDPKKNPFAALGNVTIPIVPALADTAIVVSGKITIVDGCTFRLIDFVYYNADVSYWYGGVGTSPDGMKIVDAPVAGSAFATVRDVPLITVAGAQANFAGFTQFRLYETNLKKIVATADLPALPSGTSGAPSAGASGTTTAKSDSLKASFSLSGVMFGIFLGLFLAAA